MTDVQLLPTEFAPAERASAAELSAAMTAFAQSPLVRTLLDAVPDPYVILNEQRQIVFANKPMLAIVGADTLDEVSGMRPGEALRCAHAHDTAGGCGTTQFCRECGAANAILTSLTGKADTQECRISLEDGDALDLRVTATPLAHDGAQFSMFALQDISHEKRRRALERIFFHDVLNTAGGVLGYAGIMQDASAEELEELADEIHELADQLVGEIKAQQVLSAAESGELRVSPSVVDAGELLQAVAMLYRNHPVTQGRTIRVLPPAQPIRLATDATLLRRVLGNLVKNALEASQPDQSVNVACHAGEDGVVFSVHNAAVMTDSVRLQIFQRSFSTKGAGRGLGTYSVKLLTERYLQGQVSFQSLPDRGTQFSVWLPATLSL